MIGIAAEARIERMMTQPDPTAEALARIAREREAPTGCLDLTDLDLVAVPGEICTLTHLRVLKLRGVDHSGRPRLMLGELTERLFRFSFLEELQVAFSDLPQLDYIVALKHLRDFDCSRTSVSDLAPLSGLASLQRLDCSLTSVSDLAPLSGLISLKRLDCSVTSVSDLAPLSGLVSLQELACSVTSVSDLDPLSGLVSLQELDCSVTSVSSLNPLSRLASMRQLDCSWTSVSVLIPLSDLASLREFNCSQTSVPDLTPLARLASLQQLDCSRTSVSDLNPLSDLVGLKRLTCSDTSVSDLSPISGLASLQQLNCSRTSISDLDPLSGLISLQQLDCSETSVSELSPISGLASLRQLNCSQTSVSDLSPLSGLASLQQLTCSGASVSDLSPISDLASLRQLNCSRMSVSDLSALSRLANLRQLNCSQTSVSDLSPISGLASLRQLNCSQTSVSDLSALSRLANLRQLNCSRTSVSDLSPISGLASLQQLYCSGTRISNLSPISDLANVQQFDCSDCLLDEWPIPLLNHSSLQRVIFYHGHIRNVPSEILSTSRDEDCLPRLRAHFADLAAETTFVPDIRLLIVGNGCVGKTQIARWLSGAPFEEKWDSTHGIRIETAALSDDPKTHLHLWDFGGQDIYHSTHSLFLRHPAVLIAAWSQDREVLDTYEHGGLAFRNHPLGYWIDTLRQQADPDSPLLIIQNKCDRPGEGARRLPVADATLDALPFAKILPVSAKNRLGEGALHDALAQSIAWLRDPARLGTPKIGAGRLRVQRRLETLQREDQARPPTERLHRFLEYPDFEAICAEEGGISSPEMLLDYLNANGTVLYRPGLFRERIVLDHAWALEAIYSIFERKSEVYRLVRGNYGRFTPSMLAAMVWHDRAEGERRLFLDLMRSCGICFHLRTGEAGDDWFIAPDLLPERATLSVEIDGRWDRAAQSREARFDYALLHGGLVRTIMTEIGEQAGLAALYWRGGLCGYEAGTRSRFLIEEVPGEGWAGALRIATQGGQADTLLDSLRRRVERAQAQVGMRPLEVEHPSANPETKTKPLSFAQEKPAMPEWYVSYAWKDDKSDEGREREDKVDAFCAEAETRGHRVQRDKSGIALGESISAFMQRLAVGDRIFVFLSDRYLRSPACMFELFAIWRRAQQEPAQFLDRIRVFTLDGADVWSPKGRVGYAIHWKTQRDELEALVKEAGTLSVLGSRDHAAYMRMAEFQHHVGDILALIADIRQPRTLEDLFLYGFE